jgi:TetR/AcrR family transcriptional regulator
MPATSDELRRVALELFSTSGYHATSLQRIADVAGVSKASVLYHYASKEVLLEAALSPAIDRLAGILDQAGGLTGDDRTRFLENMVDVLLEHRLAVGIFVTQSAALEDVPIVERANAFVDRIAAFFQANVESPEEMMRFGIALGGAAYLLARSDTIDGFPAQDVARPLLIAIMGELVTPARARCWPRSCSVSAVPRTAARCRC